MLFWLGRINQMSRSIDLWSYFRHTVQLAKKNIEFYTPHTTTSNKVIIMQIGHMLSLSRLLLLLLCVSKKSVLDWSTQFNFRHFVTIYEPKLCSVLTLNVIRSHVIETHTQKLHLNWKPRIVMIYLVCMYKTIGITVEKYQQRNDCYYVAYTLFIYADDKRMTLTNKPCT